MQSQLSKLIGNLLDYGPIILTVFAAAAVALLSSQSGVKIEQLVQWVLLILVLLSTTQLVDRIRLLRNVDRKIDSILESSKSQAGIDQVFLERKPSLENRLRQAKTIDHNGITLVGTSNNLTAVFSECLARDGQIRLLMVDPNDKALDVASQRFLKHQDPNMFRREAEHALDNLSSVYKEPKAKNSFKIGFARIVPPYSIWVIDANTSKAEIWVSLYSFRVDPEPSFQLFPHKDEKYFKFFQKQFELMWQSSTPWIPVSTTNPAP